MKVLLIDSQQLLYKSFFQHGKFIDDLYKAVIFGTLQQIKTLVNTIKPEYVVHCWDGPNSFRKKISPSYKSSRVYTEDVKQDLKYLFEAKDSLQSIFTMLQWNQFEEEGLEADDLIANCVLQYEVDQKVIASTDNDLYQLLSYGTYIFNTSTKKYFSKDNFRHQYGIEPKDWVEIKSIAGCTSDNVKGIDRIGEKTALKILKKQKIIAFTDKEKELISFNRKLVELPYKVIPCPELIPLKLNTDTLLDICLIYDFRSIIDNLGKWKEVFNVRRKD